MSDFLSDFFALQVVLDYFGVQEVYDSPYGRIWVSEKVPEGEIWFVNSDGFTVGKIVDVGKNEQ